MTPFEPALLVDVELGGEVSPLHLGRYRRALCLARLHGHPLGLVELRSSLGGEQLAAELRTRLAGPLAAHREWDGDGVARCLRERAWLHTHGPPATVVVPTRGESRRLRRCLTSLLDQDYPRYEIVVVDNGRTTSVRPRERVRVVHEPRPGASWARNRGLREAAGQIVAFADDDVVADRGWLTALVGAFDAVPDVGCVTGLILPLELETEAQALLEEYGGFGKGFERRIFDVCEHPSHDPLFPYTTGTLGSGASMAFRTDVIRDLGGFDLALGSGASAPGGEELLTFLRTLKAGHRVVYEPAAIVRHPHHRDYEALRNQVYRYGVGLGAYLAACVVDDPPALARFAARTLPAARYLLAADSAKNRRRSTTYPRTLAVAELAGVAAGPLAYARGRRAARALAEAA